MAAIEKDGKGRYVVRDGDRVYGTYRDEAMALYRVRQLAQSRREPKKVAK